jgi:LCP family protein required for cell wall assembly
MPAPDNEPPSKRRGESDPEPEYTVYGRGGGKRRQKPPKKSAEGSAKKSGGAPKEGKEPEYSVYKSRRRLRNLVKGGDVASLDKSRKSKDTAGKRTADKRKAERRDRGRRRYLRWALVAFFGWILISAISFTVSAQLQKGKLPDGAKDELSRNPFLLAGTNVLILGGDTRGSEAVAGGKRIGANEPGAVSGAPPRSDTIMVVHAGLGSFRKLSIPRDSFASIPGCGEQKINAAFACNTTSPKGNAALSIKTVEQFLGIDIGHVVIVDFDGFIKFIDALGGIKVDLPSRVCGRIGGGKANGGQGVNLPEGEQTLRALQALSLARVRENLCNPSENDLDRAARQQLILNGIKDRITSPLRAPYNFIKGPWIGWAAPQAFISDMGAPALAQLAVASVFAESKSSVLEPSAPGPAGSLIIPSAECRAKVEKLLGGPPPNTPLCSPGY